MRRNSAAIPVLLAAIAVVVIAAGILPAAAENSSINSVARATQLLTSYGYIVSADPAGNFHITGDLTVDGDLDAKTGAVTVASVNASDDEKRWATYLADGVDDQVTINAAVTAAGAGGKVKLSSGPFVISGFLDPGNNIWTQGAGTATRFEVANRDNTGYSTDPSDVSWGVRSGFKLSDFVMDGNSGGASGSDAHLLSFTNATDFVIENITTYAARQAGLHIAGEGTSNGTIHNYAGISNSWGAIEVSAGKRLRFANIVALNNNLSGNGHDLNFEAGNRAISDVQIANLFVRATTAGDRKGISIDGDNQNISDILVTNYIIDGGTYGVSIKGAGRTKFANGIIKNSTNGFRVSSTLVSSSNISIVNTDITNFGHRGVWIGSNVTAADNIRLSGLGINGAGTGWWGVVVGSGTSGNLTNTWLTDSQIYGAATANITGGAAALNQRSIVLDSYPWENYGSVTIPNGATQAQVSHGMQYTPAAGQVVVSPASSLGLATYLYSGNFTPTQFTVYSDADPGADVTVAWRVTRPQTGGK